jgi:hypothetical protein
MKIIMRKLKRILSGPLVWLAAAVFLIEEIIWDYTAAVMARLGALRAIHSVERQIALLRPRWAFIAFILPGTILIPAKLFGLHAIASGHWILGSGIFIVAKIIGLALFSRIFNLTRPALMKLGWFERFYTWVMSYRNRIHEYLENWPAYQHLRHQLVLWTTALKTKVAAAFGIARK